MQYYKELYLGENVASRKEKVLEKLKKKETVFNVYLIILPRYPKKQLEFFDAVLLYQKRFRQELSLVGLASGYLEALDVVKRITEDVYRETNDADIKAFFDKKAFIRL